MALKMKYFVLKPRSETSDDAYATASRAAMRVYADAIQKTDPELAIELREWATREVVRTVKVYSGEEIIKVLRSVSKCLGKNPMGMEVELNERVKELLIKLERHKEE